MAGRVAQNEEGDVPPETAPQLRLGVGGEVTELGPGDRLELPARTTHWAEVVGGKDAVHVCASA